MWRTLLVLAVSSSAALAQSGSPASEDGELAFNNSCRTCHTMREGENRLGPHLSGVIGRKAGSVEGYAYSPAMAAAGFTWDEQRLDSFIANPDAVVPSNSMKPFAGIADAERRAAIVAFLASKMN